MAGFNTTGIELAYNGGLIWGTTDVRAALIKSSYTHDPDNEYLDDITTTHEISQAPRLSSAIGSCVISVDDVNNRIELDCEDITYPSLAAGDTPDKIQFYVYNVSDSAAKALWCLEKSGSWPAPDGNNYTITMDADGAAQVAA